MIRARELSAAELLEAVLARIEAVLARIEAVLARIEAVLARIEAVLAPPRLRAPRPPLA